MVQRFLVLLLALTLATTLAFAGGEPDAVTPTAAPGEPEYGGTITFLDGYGGRVQPTSWDPADWQGSTMGYAAPYLETLLVGDFLKYGPRGSNEFGFKMMSGHVPYDMNTGLLAESWTVPDENTIIFKIRQGVMFHDKPGVMAGREFTAEDVAYSYSRNLASEARFSVYDGITVTATDKYTVEVNLSKYMPDWGWRIGSYRMYPYPRELVEAGIDDWRNHRGIGTGPFMIEDFVEGSSVTYIRNPNYWNSPTTITGFDKEYAIPFIDRFVKPLIADTSAQIAALRTGKFDVMDSVPSQFVPSLQDTNPEINFEQGLEPRGYLVGMRLDSEPFDDVRVRLAMNMAIDRQAVIDTIWAGKGSVLNFPYHSNLPETLYTPLEKLPRSTQEQFEYNPERARQLLAEAGYPNGFATTIQSFSLAPFGDMAELLVFFWKDIGVDVSIDLRERSTMNSILAGKTHEPVTLFTHGGPGDQFSGMNVYTLPTFILNTSSSTTMSIVDDNPELQELWDRATGTVELVEQQKALKELSQKSLAGTYYVILPTPQTHAAYWPWVENYYGETGELVGHIVRGIMSRVWINSALKQELIGR